jgi:hypothetical protein
LPLGPSGLYCDRRIYADDIDWSELQKQHRVVILAEAGSGKTEELRAQARALTSEGSFAFYTTVHNAAIEGFAESLPDAERGRLAAWLASDKPAWFFIDSFDEAKLTRIQLSTALRKVADGIASGLRRAHVILSGRIRRLVSLVSLIIGPTVASSRVLSLRCTFDSY